jgi:hypothetical protein
MRDRPIFFSFLSLFHFALVIWIPVQIMWMTGMNFEQLIYLEKFMNTANIALSGMFFISGISIYKANKYTPLILILTTFMLIINNYVASVNNPSYAPWPFKLSSLAYIMLLAPAFIGKNFQAMVDYRFQWWKMAPRKKSKLKVRVHCDGQAIDCESIDISESGIFLQNFYQNIEQRHITLEIQFPNNDKVFCNADVTRRCKAKGVYPEGSGLKFLDKPTGFNTSLRAFLA